MGASWLKPSDISYSQEAIACTFDNGIPIGETLDQLCDGRLRVKDLPRIEVTSSNCRWYTHNNRRLWVFRQLENMGRCQQIPVNKVNTRLPGYGNHWIRVIGNHGSDWLTNPSLAIKSLMDDLVPLITISLSATFGLFMLVYVLLIKHDMISRQLAYVNYRQEAAFATIIDGLTSPTCTTVG